MFVLATPCSMHLDSEVHQGSSTFLVRNGQGIGARDTETMLRGSRLYFDRFFTSTNLLDALMEKRLTGTGTLMRNRITKECMMIGDKAVEKIGRRASEMLVRQDTELAVFKWFTNTPVVMASSAYGIEPRDT